MNRFALLLSVSCAFFLLAAPLRAASSREHLTPGQIGSGPVEVRVEDMEATPSGVSVALKAPDSGQTLYMMIGLNEGEAIARALQHVQMARPMTHDLMKTILDRTGWHVQRVLIRAVKGNSYLADLVLQKDSETMTFDARPSDAMALAVRSDAKIFVNQDVLDQQQILTLPDTSPDQPGEQTPSGEQGTHL